MTILARLISYTFLLHFFGLDYCRVDLNVRRLYCQCDLNVEVVVLPK